MREKCTYGTHVAETVSKASVTKKKSSVTIKFINSHVLSHKTTKFCGQTDAE